MIETRKDIPGYGGKHQVGVYGPVQVTELTLALHAAGCEIRSIHEQNESLESYFMNLVGGGGHA